MKLREELILGLFLVFHAASASAQAAQPVAAASGQAKTSVQPKTSECIPECRQGFSCVQGNCVSGCNPPCAAGESCTELGQCVPATEGSAATGGAIRLMVPAQPQAHPELGPADPGWAFTAGVIGVVGAAAITGLTAGSVVTHGKSASAAFGTAGLLTLAAAAPVVAVGGMSARDNPIIEGLPTVRVLSWVGYGVTLASGMVLLVYGVDHKDVAPGLIASVGMLGVLTMTGFAVDAFTSAHQAKSPVGGVTELRPEGFSLSPVFALAPGPHGSLMGVLGAGGRF